MSLEKVKVFFMGKEINHEDLPPAPPTSLEDVFKPVTLSPLAIDLASKLVPEGFWKPYGIHTWLTGRATKAFAALPASKDTIVMGKLKYKFEYSSHGPVLKSVHLL